MTDKKVVPIHRRVSEPPASAVVPAARKVSSTDLISPGEYGRRLFRELTTAAGTAYEAAASHRLAGDVTGAVLLVNAAQALLNRAAEIGEELSRL